MDSTRDRQCSQSYVPELSLTYARRINKLRVMRFGSSEFSNAYNSSGVVTAEPAF